MELLRILIRTSAFWGKEIAALLRQPRLIFALVLGPFLILLLFGLGLRIEAKAMRTLFVAKPNSVTAQQIEKYATSLGPQLVFIGISDNLDDALARLRRNEVDVVAVAPEDAPQAVTQRQQSTFVLYHREIDPTQINYVQVFGRVYIDEVNRRILQGEIAQAQTQVPKYQEYIRQARTEASAARQALQSGDTNGAKQHQQAMNRNVDALSAAMAVGALAFGAQEASGGNAGNGSISGTLDRIQQNQNALQADDSGANSAGQIDKLNQIDSDLEKLNARLEQFKQVDPVVAVSPFKSEIKNLSDVPIRSSDFFAPAALALILQHLALTFAALSIVQEKHQGTIELFRVSPLSTAEMLLGKYFSFLLFAIIVTGILSALIVFGLGVPMLGNWVNYAVVVVLIIFTSLGLGFCISLISQTESQAIQYAMLILLASVFFSGAFLSLETLTKLVQVVSWALPATYGIAMLQDVMLRGLMPNPVLLAALGAIGLGLYLAAWWMLHRVLATR